MVVTKLVENSVFSAHHKQEHSILILQYAQLAIHSSTLHTVVKALSAELANSVVNEAGFLNHSFMLFTVYQGVRWREIKEDMERKRRSDSVQKALKEVGRIGTNTKERNKLKRDSNFCSRLSKTELAELVYD